MKEVLLALIAWGGEHWILFGWTLFWSAIILSASFGMFIRAIYYIPMRMIRGSIIKRQGWPPQHLDADGDWRPREEKK